MKVYDANDRLIEINIIKYFTLKENMKDYIFYRLYKNISSNTVFAAEVVEKENTIYLKEVEKKFLSKLKILLKQLGNEAK